MMPSKLLPKLLSAATTAIVYQASQKLDTAKPDEGSTKSSGPMTSRRAIANLHDVKAPKTSDLAGQPQRVAQLMRHLKATPDHALLSRFVKDKVSVSGASSALSIGKPYDLIVQPSFMNLCLNAAYLKEKSDIDIFIPQWSSNDTRQVKVSDAGTYEFEHDDTAALAQNLLDRLDEKECVAVLIPAHRGEASDFAHLSSVIFQKKNNALSCIIYDGVMQMSHPVVELLDALANQDEIDSFDVYIPAGESQADHYSCRTKSFVESTVALRFQKPMDNIGDLQNFTEQFEEQNLDLMSLAETNTHVNLRCFSRAMYPDKTSQSRVYQLMHPQVKDKPISANKPTLMSEHIDLYTQQVLVADRAVSGDRKSGPDRISFEKKMNLYLKLKGMTLSSRASEVADTMKVTHGKKYKKVLDELIQYHSLNTASVDSVLQAGSQEKTRKAKPWVTGRR